MSSGILGLHHVTATVDAAQPDLDFFGDVLGLRLVKKTVNFDNHHVYHFYYGDELGRPGTIWTTFPYKGYGVRVGTKGEGQITSTAFSVPASAILRWEARLRDRGVAARAAESPFGEASLSFRDPSGLIIELLSSDTDERPPWTAYGIGADWAVRGLHNVTMTVAMPEPTLAFMTGVMGFRIVNQAAGVTRLAVGGDSPGHLIEVAHAPDAPPGINGLGTVHHVAMAVADADDQLRWRQDLLRAGCQVTEVRDRQYFTSIYFREPGGVLFELATAGPGFLEDEDLAHLGQDLKLPPWEEPYRDEIVRGLAKVVTP